MKKILITLSLSLVLITPVAATLITFDDLTAADVIYTGGQIPQGYGGLGWLNFSWAQSGTDGFAGSWGQSGITGGLQPFTLNGAYLTGGSSYTEIEVRGVRTGGILYDDVFVLNNESTWVAFNYVGIDTVLFAKPGQFGNPVGSEGLHFSMDDLIINESVGAIPEPGTWFAGALLALPLAIGAFQRLRQTK